MRTYIPSILTVCLACVATAEVKAEDKPAGIPEGYKVVYEQDFEKADALRDFSFTDPNGWAIAATNGNQALRILSRKNHKYSPPVRSPVIIALISDLQLGDFILDANLLQTGREYGHRDMCLFFGFQNPEQFYYAHMATKADSHAHNIFIVNKAPRKAIAAKTTEGIVWGQNVWHKVRLVRKVESGVIEVYYDDMTNPLMLAEDRTHGAGHVGFGTFDDEGLIDNFKIYAPASVKETVKPFSKKP